MKKYFFLAFLFSFVFLNSAVWANEITITDLLNKKFEIKAMTVPFNGGIIYVLQKNKEAYLCVFNPKQGKLTTCEMIR